MPDLFAFRGLRYDLGHVGSLSNVVAPPYDVIDEQLQRALYEQHPANAIRLILNRAEPGDEDDGARYRRAAQFLRQWKQEGVLQAEPDPAVYVYHQQFEAQGRTWVRRGFMGRVRLERFGEGTIYPHEETHAAAKADRLRLWKACRANLSQIFGLYPDDSNEVQDRLETAIAGVIPLEATDHLGVVHRLWPVTDVKTIADVTGLLGPRPVFVADGHHRYETACNYRDELAAEQNLPPDHPAQCVLMMCVSMSDPGMIVLPTHRLFRGLSAMTAEQLRAKLAGDFETELAGRGPESARGVWEEIELADRQDTMALFSAADQAWTTCRLTDQGRAHLADVAGEHSTDWQALGVSILHRLIIETLVAPGETLPKPKYVHEVDELVADLRSDDAESREFGLAALVMPATIDHIKTISEHGERMPAKSTYFYPKLLSGLVINPLE